MHCKVTSICDECFQSFYPICLALYILWHKFFSEADKELINTLLSTRTMEERLIMVDAYSIRYNKVIKVSKGAKIWNQYNQVPHLTQDTNGKVTNLQ